MIGNQEVIKSLSMGHRCDRGKNYRGWGGGLDLTTSLYIHDYGKVGFYLITSLGFTKSPPVL